MNRLLWMGAALTVWGLGGDAWALERPVVFVEAAIAKSLDERWKEPVATQGLDDSIDEGAISYRSGLESCSVGYLQPLAAPYFLGAWVGYAQLFSLHGGPSAYGLDLGVAPSVVLPIYEGVLRDREFALTLGAPFGLSFPLQVAEAEAARAVEVRTHAETGTFVGLRGGLLWRWSRSVLLLNLGLIRRLTSFSVSSRLKADPSVRSSSAYLGAHSLFSVAIGYGWRL